MCVCLCLVSVSRVIVLFLFVLSGLEHSLRHGLVYDTKGYTGDYNPKVNPAVLQEHATAAFRFPHTNIAGILKFGSFSLLK